MPAEPVQPKPRQPEPVQPEPLQPTAQHEPVQPEPSPEPVQTELSLTPKSLGQKPKLNRKLQPRRSLSRLQRRSGPAHQTQQWPRGHHWSEERASRTARRQTSHRSGPRNPKAERARKAYVEKGTAEAKHILDEPSPQVPQELSDKVDFGADISSEESLEVLGFPHDPIKDLKEQEAKERRKGETPAASSSSGLAAPPLYAAGIPRVQPSASVEAELETALDLCDEIHRVLNQQPQPPKPTVQQDGSECGGPDAAADGGSSESGARVNYATESSASKRGAAARERGSRATPKKRNDIISGISHRHRSRSASPARRGELRNRKTP